MTANRRFVSKIPKSYPLEKSGPCFCAGITMFTPLKEYGAMQGKQKLFYIPGIFTSNTIKLKNLLTLAWVNNKYILSILGTK